MKPIEINLGLILENPESYTNIQDVAAMFTNSPIEDIKRGWSYVYKDARSQENALKALTEVLQVNTLKDMNGVLFDIDRIKQKVKEESFYDIGEEVILRIAEEEYNIWHAPLLEIKDLIDEEDWEVLHWALLTKFESKTGLCIEYDEKQGGWFLAEFGLISCVGRDIVEVLYSLKSCEDLINYDDKFEYILVFHPIGYHKPSKRWNSDKIVAAEPDLSRDFYLVKIDTNLIASNTEVSNT